MRNLRAPEVLYFAMLPAGHISAATRAPSRRAGLFLLAAALASGAAPAVAQVRIGLRTGIVVTTNLVRDSIVTPFSVRPNPAVFLGVAIETQIDPRYGVGVSFEVSRSDLLRRPSVDDIEITTLTIWHPAITLRHGFAAWASVEFSAGAVIYDPDRRANTLFRNDTPIEPVFGVGFSAVRSVGGRFEAALGVAYDVHRFSTSALRTVGFKGETTVHRFAVRVTVRRTVGVSR